MPDLLSRAFAEPDLPPEAVVCSLRFTDEIKDNWYLGMLDKVQKNSISYPQWRVTGQELWEHVEDCQKVPDDDDSSWKLVLHKELRSQALKECHDEATAGHLGSFKTFKRIQNLYYWPKMRHDVDRYVSRCQICQQMKSEQKKAGGLMVSGRCQPVQ